MAKIYSEPVISPLARFAFCNIETPEQRKDNQTGETFEEFSVTMLIPKSDPDIARLVGAYNEVMTKKYGADQSKWPTFRNQTFRDGDTDPTYRDATKYPGFQGMWVVKATSNTQPGMIDERKQPWMTRGTFYSGMWGYAQLTASDYEAQGNQGIKFYLNNVMKFKDDARMGSNGQTAEQAFASFPAQAGAPAAPMGMPGQAPMQQPVYGAPAAPMAQPVYGAPAAPMQQPMAQPGMMPQGQPMQQPGGYAPPAPQMPVMQPGQAPATPAFPGYNPNPLG